MSSWHSYPKIYNVGHGVVQHIFQDEVLVEEKIDGSQFSFGVFNGEIKVRSKSVQIHLDNVPGMFAKAVETVKELAPLLKDGYTYRCECLEKPKHNTLAYDRIPKKNLIIFDINTGEESYLSQEEKQAEADRIGLEIVPCLFKGKVTDLSMFQTLLENTSCLGGQKIEGVVIKNYQQFGPDKKACMAKHVSEHFKEVHGGDWKKRNPGQSDIIETITSKLKTPARWDKAIQHLQERGELTNSPKDIGKLIQEIKDDTFNEELSAIQEALYTWAENKIARGIVTGFPEYYKNRLLASQFNNLNDGTK